MTAHAHLKALIRARMAQTGESYTTARRQVLAGRNQPESLENPAATAPGFVHGDAAALARVTRLDEATAFGLGGGAGFLCFVFEYQGHPPTFTVVMRRHSLSNELADAALARSGLAVRTHTTGTPAVAARHLETALATGRPFLCSADVALLPHHGQSPMWKGITPVLVAVHGEEEGGLAIFDHGDRLLDKATFAAARAGHKKSKHALWQVEGGGPVPDAGLRAALADQAEGFLEPQMGHFQHGFGVRALRRLVHWMGDGAGKDALVRRFAGHEARLLGRLYEGVAVDLAGPDGLRGLQADFTEQAERQLGLDLPVAAWRESAAGWRRFADAVLAGDPALEALRGAIDARAAALAAGEGAETARAARAEVDVRMRAPFGGLRGHLGDLAVQLTALADLEEAATQQVRAALGGAGRSPGPRPQDS